jgi:peptidoglycan-associated lipoprotein
LAPTAASAPVVAAVELNDAYFDFDRYNIRPGDADVLNKGYGWFTANTGRVKIEGNCDERGTVEYNMVLGQKRADSTKSYMTKLGVDGNRMDTISYGKERPMDPGHNEAAWAKNRRAHFAPIE